MSKSGQKLALLLLAFMALHMAHGFLLKLPKLSRVIEKLEEDKAEQDKKLLDFFDFLAGKKEDKLAKKTEAFDQLKDLFEEKKLKKLDFLENLKEKENEFFDLKLSKKTNKKPSRKNTTTLKPCCYEETTESYSTPKYEESEESKEREYSEEVEEEQTTECNCRSTKKEIYTRPSAYDVRDDSAEGERYFT